MTTKQLYKHIETIYNHFDDFKSKMLIDNFMIIKRYGVGLPSVNSYQCFISVTDNLKLHFNISLNHRTDDKTYYRLHYEILSGEKPERYEITREIPQSFLNLFNPTLREFKIKMVMNDKEDSTQTIFEHSI
jgi:hypothetical protein